MRLILFVFLFMLICGPRLIFPDLNLLFTMLLALLSPFYLYRGPYLSKSQTFLLFLLFLSLFFSFVSLLLNGITEYSSIISSLNSLLSYIAAYSIVRMYQYHLDNTKNHIEIIIKDIQISYLINCLFVVLVMFSDQVKYYATTILSQNEKMVLLADQSIRSVDLVMGGGAVASIVFSVVFMLSLFVFLQKKDMFSIFCALSAILAITFTGRTGLLYILLFTYPFVLLFNYVTSGELKFIKMTFFFLSLLISLTLLMLIAYFLIDVFSSDTMQIISENSFAWAFEPYINFINTGKFTSESTSSLIVMYTAGIGFTDVFSFFGTSASGREAGSYLYTDVGYIRIVYTSGIIGAIVIFGKYIFLWLCNVAAILNNVKYKIYIPVLLSSLYYISIIFITNIKEYHDAIRSGFPLLMIFTNMILNHDAKLNFSKD